MSCLGFLVDSAQAADGVAPPGSADQWWLAAIGALVAAVTALAAALRGKSEQRKTDAIPDHGVQLYFDGPLNVGLAALKDIAIAATKIALNGTFTADFQRDLDERLRKTKADFYDRIEECKQHCSERIEKLENRSRETELDVKGLQTMLDERRSRQQPR